MGQDFYEETYTRIFYEVQFGMPPITLEQAVGGAVDLAEGVKRLPIMFRRDDWCLGISVDGYLR
jgi:hypothetical protein